MVNTEEFTKRLNIIMEYYDLSAAAFADKIDVGRSSISHLLSGRNKPSLDFVMKIIHAFPEVELYWLLNGKGKFPKHSSSSDSFPSPQKDLSTEEKPVLENQGKPASDKKIRRIVFFYEDGSFEAFEN